MPKWKRKGKRQKRGSQTVRVNEKGVIFPPLCLKPFNCNWEGHQKTKTCSSSREKLITFLDLKPFQ